MSQAIIGYTKVAIRHSLTSSVAQFFGDFKVPFMVVYGCIKISQTAMGVTKVAIRLSFSQPVT